MDSKIKDKTQLLKKIEHLGITLTKTYRTFMLKIRHHWGKKIKKDINTCRETHIHCKTQQSKNASSP